jgi:hypothetical protein
MNDDELIARLADPAVWAEPHPDLQERIVSAIADAGAPQPDLVAQRRSRWVPYTILGVAAAVLAAIGITIAVTSHHGSRSVEYAASLNGTKLAPSASGQVTITKTATGWRIHLHAKGLPRRDNGTYYEAWLKNSEGVLVPVGTFNQSDDVTLWAGVAPSSYPTLTVTRQLANGDPSSTGQAVLVGTSHRTH